MGQQYTCHICSTQFKTYGGLKLHRSKKHPLFFVMGRPFAMREVRMTREEEWILDNLVESEEE